MPNKRVVHKIWKYEISTHGGTVINDMPEEAKVLCVKEQYSNITLWALFKEDENAGLRSYTSI